MYAHTHIPGFKFNKRQCKFEVLTVVVVQKSIFEMSRGLQTNLCYLWLGHSAPNAKPVTNRMRP